MSEIQTETLEQTVREKNLAQLITAIYQPPGSRAGSLSYQEALESQVGPENTKRHKKVEIQTIRYRETHDDLSRRNFVIFTRTMPIPSEKPLSFKYTYERGALMLGLQYASWEDDGLTVLYPHISDDKTSLHTVKYITQIKFSHDLANELYEHFKIPAPTS